MAIVARGFAASAPAPGFFAATTPSSAAHSTARTPAKEARCWQTLECNVNIKVIKDEARKHGCPDSLRSVAWYVLSGAAQIADAAETAGYSYTTLAASTADLPDEAVFAVEDEVRLVRAAYAERRLFTTAKSAEALSRMVFAYMQRNPACGYVKGLVHIAALVLSVFGKDEEKAFWTLTALLERRMFPHCSGNVPLGSRVEVLVLQQLLEKREPALAALLSKLGPDALEQLCSSWFSTAFVRTLPLEVVVRVWDCLLVEGPKVAVRMAMAIIKMCSSSIQSCTSMETLCRVVNSRLARCTDPAPLLTLAFKGLGSLSGAVVDAARTRALAAVQQQQQQHAQALSIILQRQQRSRSGPLAAGASSSGGSEASSKQGSPGPSPRNSGALLGL